MMTHPTTELRAANVAHPSLAGRPVTGQTILALDLGTTTGWAVWTAEGVILSGTVSFRPSRYDGGGMRYLRFRSWLEELLEDADGLLAAVWFEEVRRHAGTDASHVYGGMLATLSSWCETRAIARLQLGGAEMIHNLHHSCPSVIVGQNSNRLNSHRESPWWRVNPPEFV